MLGILLQVISALGYLAIVNVTSIANERFRDDLMLELVPGRIKLAGPGIHDLAGFVLLVAGSVFIVTKTQPKQLAVLSAAGWAAPSCIGVFSTREAATKRGSRQ